MKRVVWLTDIHLNFVAWQRTAAFLDEVSAQQPEAVLIGGDIAEAHDVCDYLREMQQLISAPIYFVLGNHDYYLGSIVETRQRVVALCREHPRLHYLSVDDSHPLTSHVGVVGHDGWADGRLGNYLRSLVVMHDWKLITELTGHDKPSRWEVLKGLADEAAAHIRRVLPTALEHYREVVLLTHVPPLLEACWHEGGISNEQWSPHFTCHAMGEAILEIMRPRTDRRLLVLCGHTHGEGETQPLPNVHVITGGAQYGAPRSPGCLSLTDAA